MAFEDGTFAIGGEPEVTSQVAGVSAGARGDLFSPQCPTRRLLDRIGTKWVSMAVKVLAQESPDELRFSELQRRMPGISQKMLSSTLQNMVRDGLVARRVEPTVPPRVHYRLTPLGLSLEQPLAMVRAWAEEHMPEIDRAIRLSQSNAVDGNGRAHAALH